MAKKPEVSSAKLLKIAGRGMKKPESLTLEEIKSVCASVVTQAADKPKS